MITNKILGLPAFLMLMSLMVKSQTNGIVAAKSTEGITNRQVGYGLSTYEDASTISIAYLENQVSILGSNLAPTCGNTAYLIRRRRNGEIAFIRQLSNKRQLLTEVSAVGGTNGLCYVYGVTGDSIALGGVKIGMNSSRRTGLLNRCADSTRFAFLYCLDSIGHVLYGKVISLIAANTSNQADLTYSTGLKDSSFHFILATNAINDIPLNVMIGDLSVTYRGAAKVTLDKFGNVISVVEMRGALSSVLGLSAVDANHQAVTSSLISETPSLGYNRNPLCG